MVEAGANEVPEDVVVEALQVAQEAISTQAKAIEEWAAEHGKEKQQFDVGGDNPFVDELRGEYLARIKESIVSTDRRARNDELDRVERRGRRRPR